MNLRYILIPLDGSPCAERALPVAARLARACGGMVLLVHATSLTRTSCALPAPYPVITPLQIEEEQHNAEQYLSRVAASPMLAGIKTVSIIRSEEAASAILAAADIHEADMIVLCSHGRAGFASWAMGSVAEKVAHHAHVPVLIVRQDGLLPLGLHPDPTVPFRILVPLDGSMLAKAALEPAVTLATTLSAPAQGIIHLVRVIPPRLRTPGQPGVEDYELIYHHACLSLERTIQRLQEERATAQGEPLPPTFTYSVIISDDIASALVTTAEYGNEIEGMGRCDVIAMATHGRTGFQRWTMGSVTERVLHETRLPLLIVRSTEPADPQVITGFHEASRSLG